MRRTSILADGECSRLQQVVCGCVQVVATLRATLFVSYCISDSACSKNYKAKGNICMSIFDQ